jgi:hypothetical protein
MLFGFRLIGLRAKYRFAVSAFAVNAILFIFLSIYFSGFFVLGLTAAVIIAGLYLQNIKCPVCGKPALLNPVRIYGIVYHHHTRCLFAMRQSS